MRNAMVTNGMIPGKPGETSVRARAPGGNQMMSARAAVGGFAEVLAKLDADVGKGERIAVQRNVSGDVVKEYFAPAAGRVLSIGDDPLREPCGLLVRLPIRNPDPACKSGC